MKKVILVLLASCLSGGIFAQKESKADVLKKNENPVPQKKYSCDSINVNFETGLLNGKIGPSSPPDSIKKFLPCVSAEYPMGDDQQVCGGGLSLDKQGIYFNLEHGLIEFSSNTTAFLPAKILGAAEDDLAGLMQMEPTQITDIQPVGDRPIISVYLFPKNYGCVAIWVDQKDKKAFKIQVHNVDASKVYLCIY